MRTQKIKMKKFLTVLSILIFAISISSVFVGCSASDKIDTEGKTSVVFELEGGMFQNCEGKVIHYYELPESGETLIYSPQELSSRDVTKTKNTFGGWFRTKSGTGDGATYSDEWDFQVDKLTSSGLTLYAKWIPNVKHVYRVCYIDDKGETKVLGSYNAVAGDKFDDWMNYAKKRNGYTALSFTDVDGNAWNPDFEFPQVEDDYTVDVYVQYLKGRYTLVYTEAEMTKALSRTANIYLMADIDMNGKKLNFKDYSGTFMGNGHTVSNFEVYYTALKDDVDGNGNKTYASILGNTDGAIVENVTFENGVLNFKTMYTGTHKGIFIAPLSVNLTKTTLTNVKVDGLVININQLPEGFRDDDPELFRIITDKLYDEKDEASTIEGCSLANVEVKLNYKTEK